MKKTGAVLVAAGLSSRMKDFKPMLPFGTSTASRHMIGMLKSLKAAPIVVVTGYRAEELEAHLSDTGVCFVRNNRYRETEMFDSIKIGVKEIEAECERIMIFPIDVPAIRLSTIWKAMMADAPIVRTTCQGKPGHPIIVQTDLFPLLWASGGKGGLRGAVERSGIPVMELEVEDEGIYKDMDTREQYVQLLWQEYCNCKSGYQAGACHAF